MEECLGPCLEPPSSTLPSLPSWECMPPWTDLSPFRERSLPPSLLAHTTNRANLGRVPTNRLVWMYGEYGSRKCARHSTFYVQFDCESSTQLMCYPPLSQVEVRPMMYVALTYDHRLIDGREAVLFLKKIKQAVEDPRILLLGL